MSTVAVERMAYSIQEVLEAVPVSRATLMRALAAGQIRSVKLGRRTLIPRDELERLLRDGVRTVAAWTTTRVEEGNGKCRPTRC